MTFIEFANESSPANSSLFATKVADYSACPTDLIPTRVFNCITKRLFSFHIFVIITTMKR
jgi:hypothetical protein